MRIIERGTPPARECLCGVCGSRLEYTRDDVVISAGGGAVCCPVCGADVRVDGPQAARPGAGPAEVAELRRDVEALRTGVIRLQAQVSALYNVTCDAGAARLRRWNDNRDVRQA